MSTPRAIWSENWVYDGYDSCAAQNGDHRGLAERGLVLEPFPAPNTVRLRFDPEAAAEYLAKPPIVISLGCGPDNNPCHVGTYIDHDGVERYVHSIARDLDRLGGAPIDPDEYVDRDRA